MSLDFDTKQLNGMHIVLASLDQLTTTSPKPRPEVKKITTVL